MRTVSVKNEPIKPLSFLIGLLVIIAGVSLVFAAIAASSVSNLYSVLVSAF